MQTPDLSCSHIFYKQSKLLIKVDLIKSTSRVNCWFKVDLMKSLSRVNCRSISSRVNMLIKVDLMKLLSRINCLTKSILWNNVEILWNHWAVQTPDLSCSHIFYKQSKLLIKVDLIKSTSRVNCLSTLILWIIEQNKLLIQSWSYVIIEQSQLLINVYLMKESSRINCCFKVDLMK